MVGDWPGLTASRGRSTFLPSGKKMLETDDNARLEPIPAGWYCVGFTDELARGEVKTQLLGGRERVVFRTRGGRAAVVDAFCPHLGAHLGHGGTVVGETLRCPFHGFCFDVEGACTQTGYGTRPPPKARLGALAVIERLGAVFVHLDPHGRDPAWEIPDIDQTGWTPIRHRRIRLRSHPQEVAENSVDVGHFAHVHGYEEVRETRALTTSGPLLRVGYGMRRRRPRALVFRDLAIEFDIHQYGLGCAFVEARTSVGLLSRQLVLVTPLGAGEVDLRIGCSVRRAEPGARSRLLGFFPAAWLAELAFRAFEKDVEQDLDIWNHKRFVHPPALAEGDGPIGTYRKWARQFYPARPGGEARALRVAGGGER